MDATPSGESAYLASASAGSSEAFTALVEPHRKPLLIHCYRLSGSLDDAEDLVQETFVRAWGRLKTYEGQGSFRNWLYVIATRLWLDEARKNLEASPYREAIAPEPYLDQFVTAWESGDVHSLVQLLHEKATFAMPPMGVWYSGRESIQRALQNLVLLPGAQWKLVRTSANGGPAYGIYREAGDNFQAFGLLLPIYAIDKIVEVTVFLSSQLAARFNLPETISFQV